MKLQYQALSKLCDSYHDKLNDVYIHTSELEDTVSVLKYECEQLTILVESLNKQIKKGFLQ